ncbi:hypothetical protein ABZP36_017544 [Zizania latifolia]
MGDDDDDTNGLHEQTAGCLPVDQSCFALSRLSSSYHSRSSNPHGCCTITSYLEVLTISFASLLVILVILCVIRCYLVRRAGNRDTVEVAAVRKNRPPPGLGEDAIAALPKFEYHDTEVVNKQTTTSARRRHWRLRLGRRRRQSRWLDVYNSWAPY